MKKISRQVKKTELGSNQRQADNSSGLFRIYYILNKWQERPITETPVHFLTTILDNCNFSETFLLHFKE